MRAWKELRQLKKDQQPWLLSFWCSECALIGKWFAKWNKLRHYCWILGQDARKDNRMVKFIKPKPTELIALSPFLQEEFFGNHGIQPSVIIPNAIDPQSFLHTSSKRTIDVIGVGSLIPLKQYNVFVSVLKKVVDQIPSLRAVICGEGPEFDSLKRMIIDAGLKQNIQLAGEKTHEEILLLFQLSKILLHPSSYEGYSSVCLEALYAGAHVISFRSPTADVIDHWHVVEAIEEMEKKVIAVLSDPAVDHKRVLLHTVEESAKAMVDLFCEKQIVEANARVEG
jgi:glycosyltransferase involved in cell wall biosynthesis